MGEARLFEEYKCRDVRSRNRIVASPMCQYSAVNGALTDWHLAHLGRLAIGGAGVVFVEETAVEARGRKTHRCAGIWSESQVDSFRRAATLIQQAGALPAIQLGHSGRKGSTHDAQSGWRPLVAKDAEEGLPGWQTVAPSAVPVNSNWPVPHALTKNEIAGVVEAFALAARRAAKAGYSILEVHGAHGYLIHQFLSPVSNRRTDQYGGARANRMRFAIEVAEAVRASWPAGRPLFFRVSCVDGKGGRWDLEDTIQLARELTARGVDVISCSSGGITGNSTMPIVRRIPGYHVPFAQAVRRAAGVSTLVVGLITDPVQAEKILACGAADLIGLARELLSQGDWPVRAASVLGIADPLSLLPTEYAFRLRRREEVSRMPINQPGGSEVSLDELIKIEST